MLSLAYGYNIKSLDHPVVKLVQEFNHIITAATPEKAALLDIFPFGEHDTPFHPRSALNIAIVKYMPSWIPGLGFLERAAVSRKMVIEVLEQPFEYTKNEVVSDSNIFLLLVCFNSILSRLPVLRHNRWWLIF